MLAGYIFVSYGSIHIWIFPCQNDNIITTLQNLFATKADSNLKSMPLSMNSIIQYIKKWKDRV